MRSESRGLPNSPYVLYFTFEVQKRGYGPKDEDLSVAPSLFCRLEPFYEAKPSMHRKTGHCGPLPSLPWMLIVHV